MAFAALPLCADEMRPAMPAKAATNSGPYANDLTPIEKNLLKQWRDEPEVFNLTSYHEFLTEESYKTQLSQDYQRASVASIAPPAQTPYEVVHFREVKAKAKSGDPNAELELGSLYDTGNGVIIDHEEAVGWWMKAADRGLAVAENNIAAAYTTGLGVPRDYEKSAEWYRKAADQSNTTAQAELGWMYFSGVGVKKDKDMAKQLWLKAADDSAKAKFGLHVLSNMRKLTDGDNPIYGCIMGISLDGTFPDQILYVGDDGVLCSQLKLADASKSIQQDYGYSPERAAAYHADRAARQKAASEVRVKELETVLRRLTALRRERQIDDLNDNLRNLTETLDQRNGAVMAKPTTGVSMQELDQKIFDLQQSIDQLTEEPLPTGPPPK